MIGAFERLFPEALFPGIPRFGDDIVFPLCITTSAISRASENEIAVLGVEIVRITAKTRELCEQSTYEFYFLDDWLDFVRRNNEAARSFIVKNQRELPYGYLFTTVSLQEFRELGHNR